LNLSPSSALPDPIQSRRSQAGTLLRFVYSALILGIAIFLGWQVVKPFLYSQSTGWVSAPMYVLSTPYTAQVTDIDVRPGDWVSPGDVVATVKSPQIDTLRANLLSSVADQINKEADLSIRLEVARRSQAPARARLQAAQEMFDLMRKHPDAVTTLYRAQALQEIAMAQQNLAQIEVDISVVSAQLVGVTKAREDLQDIRSMVELSFNDGKQVSPAFGIVSSHMATPGQSLPPGNPIIDLYDPTRTHIEWTLQPDRIRQPQVGSRVYVIDGNVVLPGTITRLYSMAETPPTNGDMFERPQTGQLVRIDLLDGTAYPPVRTEVQVRYNYWRFMDKAVELYVQAMVWLGVWRER
jgi:multidrug resistance efflux pump